jgi:membrane fusion protein (multidrug efflux system)
MKNLCNFLIVLLLLSCSEKKAVVMPPQKLPVIKVEKGDVQLYEQFVGQVYGMKDVPVRARMEGVLLKIHFSEGEEVKEGDLLYSVDPDQILANVASQKAKLAEAQTILANAENELERYKPLAKINAVSKSDLDYAQSKRDAAAASVEAARGNLKASEINLGYTEISSPITGFIGKTNAEEGEFVGRDPNPVILNTISRIDTVKVHFFLTESEYLKVARYISTHRDELEKIDRSDREGSLSLILSDGSTHPYKGKVDFINREVDATTGAILVQASFPNPNLIVRPGQFARVSAKMGVKKDGILIPQRCVSELQGQFSVYTVTDSSTIKTKRVMVGEKVDDMWLIEEGLEAGDVLVLEGIQKVRSGMKIDPEMTIFKSVGAKE